MTKRTENERKPCDGEPGGTKRPDAVIVVTERRYAFPTVSRCPRCGALDTICRHTDSKKGWQYRKCQRAVCHHTYIVRGNQI